MDSTGHRSPMTPFTRPNKNEGLQNIYSISLKHGSFDLCNSCRYQAGPQPLTKVKTAACFAYRFIYSKLAFLFSRVNMVYAYITPRSPPLRQILHDFPEELRGDVSMHIHRELLQLPIFVTASTGCQKLLSLHVKDSFCAPGEYLVHCGDALHYIYYLCNGSMEVVQTDMVVAILGESDGGFGSEASRARLVILWAFILIDTYIVSIHILYDRVKMCTLLFMLLWKLLNICRLHTDLFVTKSVCAFTYIIFY